MSRSNVIMAEAQGQSWLQRNWRPLLMLVIITIVANNYILYPYLSIFTDKVRVLGQAMATHGDLPVAGR